jgi:hypothetical protein
MEGDWIVVLCWPRATNLERKDTTDPTGNPAQISTSENDLLLEVVWPIQRDCT